MGNLFESTLRQPVAKRVCSIWTANPFREQHLAQSLIEVFIANWSFHRKCHSICVWTIRVCSSAICSSSRALLAAQSRLALNKLILHDFWMATSKPSRLSTSFLLHTFFALVYILVGSAFVEWHNVAGVTFVTICQLIPVFLRRHVLRALVACGRVMQSSQSSGRGYARNTLTVMWAISDANQMWLHPASRRRSIVGRGTLLTR